MTTTILIQSNVFCSFLLNIQTDHIKICFKFDLISFSLIRMSHVSTNNGNEHVPDEKKHLREACLQTIPSLTRTSKVLVNLSRFCCSSCLLECNIYDHFRLHKDHEDHFLAKLDIFEVSGLALGAVVTFNGQCHDSFTNKFVIHIYIFNYS